MKEDAATCEKAVTEMSALKDDEMAVKDINQMVRWVNNKESHAEKIIGTIANYFLTQRVKTDAADFSTRLAAHLAVMIAAMKVKQDANLSTVTALKAATAKLDQYYPEPG